MTTELAEGQLLREYEVLSIAGAGGMGVVYRGKQRSLGRTVALKVIREEIAEAPEYRERFLREARLAASVDHPHVVTVYDMGEEDGHLFLTMQWIQGEDLKQMLERSGRLAPERAVSITAQLAGALDALHSVAGLIHRDVKPGNVLIRQVEGTDYVYLTDFGVAKPAESAEHLTKTGSVVGTAGYLSPEQIRGRDPGPESDLYGLGCLFFEALTGRPPFEAENEMALRWAHANDPRPAASAILPGIGERYDRFLARALAIDPAQRFASGRELADALSAAHEGAPLSGAVTNVGASQTPPPTPRTPTAVGPPTPMPPAPGTPPPPGAGYPPYGYVTPPPAAAPPGRSGNPLALVLLGLVALAGIAVGALAAGGVFSHKQPSQTITRISTPAPQPRTTPKAAPARPPSAASSSAPGGTTSCGGDVSVGPDTSCGFAQNVEQAYDQTSGGSQSVSAYSPATGITYTIDCSGGTPHVCTGGTTHDASVYFTSGPTSGGPSASAASTPATGMRACDQNISANQHASCPFAANVFKAYASDYQANGEQATDTVTAFSSVTNQSYPVTCDTDGVTVTCTGSNQQLVTFPLHAVEVY